MKIENCLLALVGLAALSLPGSASAALVIRGVVDGDLTGGIPKAIILSATSDVADLSIYGVGSANNGGGSDGQEFTLSGTATSGDTIIVASNTASTDFFTSNYSDSLIMFTNGVSSINGDDAIELFQNNAVLDTYGDIDLDGTGQSWEYVDGYAVRTGGVAGAFDQANYSSNLRALDGLDGPGQAAVIGNAFGFTAVPEPGSLSLLAVAGLAGVFRRRRV
ncbi:MAG: hypothetical protein Aurels2KO_24370 [Aureliella sp.]